MRREDTASVERPWILESHWELATEVWRAIPEGGITAPDLFSKVGASCSDVLSCLKRKKIVVVASRASGTGRDLYFRGSTSSLVEVLFSPKGRRRLFDLNTGEFMDDGEVEEMERLILKALEAYGKEIGQPVCLAQDIVRYLSEQIMEAYRS